MKIQRKCANKFYLKKKREETNLWLNISAYFVEHMTHTYKVKKHKKNAKKLKVKPISIDTYTVYRVEPIQRP